MKWKFLEDMFMGVLRKNPDGAVRIGTRQIPRGHQAI